MRVRGVLHVEKVEGRPRGGGRGCGCRGRGWGGQEAVVHRRPHGRGGGGGGGISGAAPGAGAELPHAARRELVLEEEGPPFPGGEGEKAVVQGAALLRLERQRVCGLLLLVRGGGGGGGRGGRGEDGLEAPEAAEGHDLFGLCVWFGFGFVVGI